MQSVQVTGLKRSANPGPVQVIAVTGGKGGVGKTSVAVNLATALGSTGKRVLLLDGDLGLANVDVFLGLSPRHTMAQVLAGERSLEEIIVESPYGVNVVPGASGVAELANLPAAAHLQLVQAFSALSTRVDTLIVDTSAGIAHSVVQFTQAAQHVLPQQLWIAAVVLHRKAGLDWKFLVLPVLVVWQLFGVTLVYVTGPVNLQWMIGSSLDRVLSQIAPLALLGSGIVVGRWYQAAEARTPVPEKEAAPVPRKKQGRKARA